MTLAFDPLEPEEERPQPRTGRRVLRIVAIVVGILILLVAALPYLVSLDRARTRVLSAAEAALHRKVEVGTIRLQILSGLGARAEKVVVRNKAGWGSPALLTADRVSVKLAFWPLLSRRIEVRKVVLDGVTFTIERNPKGALNIDDFLSAGGRPSEGAKSATAGAFLVSNAEIKRGRLQLVDRKVVPGETVTTVLEELSGRIADMSPSKPARFDMTARFLADTGRNLTLKGTFGPPIPGEPLGDAALAATLSAKNLALARLGPYLGTKPEVDPGVLSLDASADGAVLAPLKLGGNLVLVPREGGGSPIPALDGQFVAMLDWPGATLALEKSPFTVAKLPLMVEGRVQDLRATPRLDLEIATPGEVEIENVTALPGLAGTLPAGMTIAGRVRLTAEISGPTGDLAAHASLSAAPFELSRDGRPFLTAANATATLESRGQGPRTGRVRIPAGKLEELPFENLLADWSWDKRVLTLCARGGGLRRRDRGPLDPRAGGHDRRGRYSGGRRPGRVEGAGRCTPGRTAAAREAGASRGASSHADAALTQPLSSRAKRGIPCSIETVEVEYGILRRYATQDDRTRGRPVT